MEIIIFKTIYFRIIIFKTINNFQNNQSNNNNDEIYINLVFVVANEKNKYSISFPCKPTEYLSSVITRFIDKTNNYDINYYLFNGHRLDETKTLYAQGLYNGSNIFVVNTENIMGAF